MGIMIRLKLRLRSNAVLGSALRKNLSSAPITQLVSARRYRAVMFLNVITLQVNLEERIYIALWNSNGQQNNNTFLCYKNMQAVNKWQ